MHISLFSYIVSWGCQKILLYNGKAVPIAHTVNFKKIQIYSFFVVVLIAVCSSFPLYSVIKLEAN